ncbi:CtsR family transcriptional regulator [Anaerobacillus isosaccharinicus]|uniref:Transcriptional regulator CtsR n=1 Tax=Anaerobacillus isosaccharinicus TaxID=1532552 RepID=A0A1S2MFF7_9BACI|nr:CtsR family transcriptional regulator [Anaerobacillus isosaccharinicus]MBA5584091.1 CtsR family transcriptional regulator [Anaerobacillus isosaccharinicus]QOY37497.1 CtsR family transcriptional regulator [Anaerobacillus isosaccharinicus]
MKNVSDIIEHYLKAILLKSESDIVEIKRSELAERFQCVPSQINYVISTRFTVEKGYLVESKRGGGGFIRIIKVKAHNNVELYDQMLRLLGDGISQNGAEDIIYRLYDEEAITKREANLLRSATDRSVLNLHLPYRDQLRANILKAMISTLKFKYQ